MLVATVLVVAVITAIVVNWGMPAGPTEVREIKELDMSQAIVLDFGSLRLRVEGWDESRVEIVANGPSEDGPIKVNVSSNRITCHSPVKPRPYWEPAYLVRVPSTNSVKVIGGQIWARDCTLGHLWAEYADLCDCTLDDGFIAEVNHVNIRRCKAVGRASYVKQGRPTAYPITTSGRTDVEWRR